MNRLARREVESLAANGRRLVLQADQVDCDLSARRLIPRHMPEGAGIKIAPQFAVGAGQ